MDAVIADLPYGTTACKWDSILPLNELWKEYKRVLKPSGVIILTASETIYKHIDKQRFENV